MREHFHLRGYELDPPQADDSEVFVAHREQGTVRVVGVAVEEVDGVIAVVGEHIAELERSGFRTEGCLILTIRDGEARQAQKRKVLDAGLRALWVEELASDRASVIDVLAHRQLVSLNSEAAQPEFRRLEWDGMHEIARMEAGVRAWLRSPERLLVIRVRSRDQALLANRLLRVIASGSVISGDTPAPLYLRVASGWSREWDPLLAAALSVHELRCEVATIRNMIEEGMLLPVFHLVGVTLNDELELLRRALDGRARAVALVGEADPAGVAEIEKRLDLPISGVRITGSGTEVDGAAPAARDGPALLVIASAAKDKRWRDALISHIKPLSDRGIVRIWHSDMIHPGADVLVARKDYLARAHIVVLLLSADFMSSSFCSAGDLYMVLDRQQRGNARVIPVQVRACDLADTPLMGVQVLPRDGRPIEVWAHPDDAWSDVARSVRALVRGDA